MKIINTNEDLLQFIPNVFATAIGEDNVFGKIEPFLKIAESAFIEKVAGAAIDIIASDKKSEAYNFAAVAIVSDAFMNAVPSLDLVLTPNGFGIVSTSTVAPASKDRVERLIQQLELSRDMAIASILPMLPTISKNWLTTPQAHFFAETLFPNPIFEKDLMKYTKLWDNYLADRHKFIQWELKIANEWISPEYMQELRNACLDEKNMKLEDKRIVSQLRPIILRAIFSEKLDSYSLDCIVDYIKDHPDLYPTWHSSETSKIYEASFFENKKENHGYFF